MDPLNVFLTSAPHEEAARVANVEKKLEDVEQDLAKETGFSGDQVKTFVNNMEAFKDEEEAMVDEMIADFNAEMAAGAEAMGELTEEATALTQKQLEELEGKGSN